MRTLPSATLILLCAGSAQAQYAAIPDPNFEQELIIDGVDSEGVLDGRILTSDAAATEVLILTGTFKPNIAKITSLSGIGAFTTLRVLRAGGNLLTDIDVSQNLDLEELQVHLNNLLALDVSNNSQLTLLYANNNALTGVDGLESLPSLQALRLFNNQIRSLNLSGAASLTELRIQSNDLLGNLYLDQHPLLTTFAANTNPGLECIQVADAAAADAGVGIYAAWTKATGASYSESCPTPGVAKDMVPTNAGLPATITIDFSLENFSAAETYFNLSIQDDLSAVFGVHGTDWVFASISSVPVTLASPLFDGHTTLELVNQAPAQDVGPGSAATITVQLQLLTLNGADLSGDFSNQVQLILQTESGVGLVDLSTSGTDPDPNGDGNPMESSAAVFNSLALPVTLMSISVE